MNEPREKRIDPHTRTGGTTGAMSDPFASPLVAGCLALWDVAPSEATWHLRNL
jgi:hypothetical protein